MKKLFLNFMTIVFAMSLVLVSCDPKNGNDDTTTPDDPNTGGGNNVEQEQPTTPSWEEQGYTVANAAFGTAYPALSFIDVTLATETDSLTISFSTDGEEELPLGDYTVDENPDDDEYPAGTYDPYYSYWYNAENISYITNGTISVTKAGRNYTVKTDCVDENGDSVKWVYVGQIDLEVEAQEPAQPEFDLTWNDIDPEYSLYLHVSDYNLYRYILAIVDPETGWEIDLDFLGNATDTEGKLPTGTFTMLTSAITEYGILPGYVDDDGYTNGSYAINWEDANSTFNPFVDGSFTITEADGNTTLEGSFTTESGDEVSVNVTGTTPTIELYTPSGAPVKKSIVAKQGRTISKRFMRK